MQFREVGNKMLEYSLGNKYLKILLPFSYILLIGAAALSLLGSFVSLGSAMNAILFFAFYLGVVLTFAKSEYLFLSIGLGIKSLDYVYSFFRSLFRYGSLSWGALIYILGFGLLTYLAYRESLKG